jgi:hypothetical protein
MKFISLNKGYRAMVDDEDYDRVMKYRWKVHINIQRPSCIYARTNISNRTVILHRFIMSPTKEITIDHIDHNGLNCQKSNLRFATKTQQNFNRKRSNSHGYKGITRVTNQPNKWQVQLVENGNVHYGGVYKTMIDAAKAYDEMAKKYHGDFAILNFPTPQ